MNAEPAYAQKMENIHTLITRLQQGLQAHQGELGSKQSPHNWAHVGDLGHVEEELQRLVNFLGAS